MRADAHDPISPGFAPRTRVTFPPHQTRGCYARAPSHTHGEACGAPAPYVAREEPSRSVVGGGSRSRDLVRMTNVLNSLRGTPIVQVCLARRFTRPLRMHHHEPDAPTTLLPARLPNLSSRVRCSHRPSHAPGRLMACCQAHGADHCVSLPSWRVTRAQARPTPLMAATPNTAAATPIINPSPSPSELGRGGFDPAGAPGGSSGGGAYLAPCMSLDAFLAKYISEDNASFGAILLKHNEKRLVKAKYEAPPRSASALRSPLAKPPCGAIGY